MSLLDIGGRRRWRVDPNGGRWWWRHRQAGGEALGVGGVRGGEDPSSSRDALISEAAVDVTRGHPRYPSH